MIGQKGLIEQLQDNLARFSIFAGQKGSGRKILAEYIGAQYGTIYRVPDVKIETVRWLINEAYSTRVPAVFIIADADNMSTNAKNALLKLTEEPPNNAYIIMTLEDVNNTLETIRSRATVYNMAKYTREELAQFFDEHYKGTDDYKKLVLDLSDTPGDIILLQHTGEEGNVEKFYKYVEKVFESIGAVSGANALKISQQIALKDTDENKYDLRLFWRAFQKIALSRASEFEGTKAIQMIQITSRALQDLKIKSVNKAMLFDIWVLDIRRVWF